MILNLKIETEMERIDLFDRYIKGELSDTERSEFRTRLESDGDFASEFNVYRLTVSGIRREAHQDNLDFGIAMKNLSKEQLFDVIGRKPKVLSKDEIAAKLRGQFASNDKMSEFSGMAALDNSDDDEFDSEPNSIKESGKSNNDEVKNNNSMRIFTLIFIGIIVLLILIGLLF